MKIKILFLSLSLSCAIFATDYQVGNIGYGVTGPEGATGTGYLLFSVENVHTRFSTFPDQSDHFMAVQWVGNQWVQYNNETAVPFIPIASDVLVATLNFSDDTAEVNVGKRDTIHGIRRGVKSTDLTITMNQWNGVGNPGELTAQGTVLETFPDDPQWWSEGAPPVIISGSSSSNYSSATIGQAKFFALRALEALERVNPLAAKGVRIRLLGGANAISSFDPPTTEVEKQAQRAMLNLGQLKAIVKPFYDYFNQSAPNWLLSQLDRNGLSVEGVHYWRVSNNPSYMNNGYYPWNPDFPVSKNNTPVNLGQLKALFAFRTMQDLDGDLIPDFFDESYYDQYNLDPNISDFDGDGILDIDEYKKYGSSPFLKDSDKDGMHDSWEVGYSLDPNDGSDGSLDLDQDGLSNLVEFEIQTDPRDQDTDDDFVSDFDEYNN